MKEENFEENLKTLETIVKKLEEGNLNLDESVTEFENGMKISKKCSQMLENAENKITILINKNGKIEEEFKN